MPESSTSATTVTSEQCVSNCLYCGGGKSKLWLQHVRDRLGYVPGEWEFYKCKDCGSATLHPMPTPAELASYYPPVYTFSPELASRSSLQRLMAALEYALFFNPQYWAQVSKVRKYALSRKITGKRLLDVGCGRGLRLLEFRKAGFDVHGCDFAQEAVDYLREHQGIPAKCGDIGKLDDIYGESTFDIVTAFHVFEHLPDVKSVLQSCHRVIKPGGFVAIASPLSDSLQADAFGGRWVTIGEAPRHTNVPSQKGLRELCRQIGFIEESIRFSADSTLGSAAIAAMSLIPGSSTTNVYSSGKWWPLAARILGAAVTYLAVPWALTDKWIIGRPAAGIIFAQKSL